MSPFKSVAQRKYMYSNNPEIAKRWGKRYGKAIQPNTLIDEKQDSGSYMEAYRKYRKNKSK